MEPDTNKSKGSFNVLSLNLADFRTREYKKRKLHQKVKSGCITCRAKRVKCDEQRPVCVRCQRNNRPCQYKDDNSFPPQPTAAKPSKFSPPKIPSTSLTTFLPSTLLPPGLNPPAPLTGTSTLQLLHHLSNHWRLILTIPDPAPMLSISRSHSLVLHTVLALTASHLRHFSPDGLSHRIAEHFQQSLALAEYQRYLDCNVKDLGQDGVNALFVGGTGLMMLTFILPHGEAPRPTPPPQRHPNQNLKSSLGSPSGDPTTSNTAPQNSSSVPLDTSFTNDYFAQTIDWLALQLGIRPLMQSPVLLPYVHGVMALLGNAFLGPQLTKRWMKLPSGLPGLEGLPPEWMKWFELDRGMGEAGCDVAEGEMSRGAVLLPAIKLLAVLRQLPHPQASTPNRSGKPATSNHTSPHKTPSPQTNLTIRGAQPSPTEHHSCTPEPDTLAEGPLETSVFTHLTFFSKISVEFRYLLAQRDELAIWVMGYWLGLMLRFDASFYTPDAGSSDSSPSTIASGNLNRIDSEDGGSRTEGEKTRKEKEKSKAKSRRQGEWGSWVFSVEGQNTEMDVDKEAPATEDENTAQPRAGEIDWQTSQEATAAANSPFALKNKQQEQGGGIWWARDRVRRDYTAVMGWFAEQTRLRAERRSDVVIVNMEVGHVGGGAMNVDAEYFSEKDVIWDAMMMEIEAAPYLGLSNSERMRLRV